jgi:regulatory protein
MPRTRRKKSSSSSPSSSEKASSPLAEAKSDAYRLISRRTRTRKEIQDRLQQRGHAEGVIEETLQSLSDLGYVNDAEFAREWCRYRLESRPLGARALQRELFSKGVSTELAEAAVQEAFEHVSEADLAKRLAAKRMKNGFDAKTPKDVKRLREFLLRRGFSFESIEEAISSVDASSFPEFPE